MHLVNQDKKNVWTKQDIVHELAHVWDNNTGGMLPAVFVGGGLSDQMVKGLGGDSGLSPNGRDPRHSSLTVKGIPIINRAFRFEWGGFYMPKKNTWELQILKDYMVIETVLTILQTHLHILCLEQKG